MCYGMKTAAYAGVGLAFIVTAFVSIAGNVDPQKGKADPDGKTIWYDCKDLIVEGKGWTDTESFYDRLPAKAKEVAPKSVWGA